jgi:hypothetical protein
VLVRLSEGSLQGGVFDSQDLVGAQRRLAARPGTAVLPMCSMATTRLPSTDLTLVASFEKAAGHEGS